MSAAEARQLDDLWDRCDRYRRLGLDLPPSDEPQTRDHRNHRRLVQLVVAGDATDTGEDP